MAFPRPPLIFVLALGLLGFRAFAGSPAEAMRILKSNCVSCHNEEKKKGGLLMTSREGLLKGGDNGPALVAGDPAASEMIASLEPGADPHMPPKKQLAPAQIATLSQWVKEGANWDAAALKATEASAPRTVTLRELPPTYRPVLALALSPDGRRLAVGWGNRLLLYEIAEKSLTLAGQASAHPDPIQSVTWSADGARLATGAFRRVVLWNTDNLATERQITKGLTDRITSLRFLPDQRLVIADGRVAEKGTLRIADTTTGALGVSWDGHGDTIFDVAVSPDGALLATAGGDKLVKIWEVATQKEVARMEGHVAQVLAVAFNKDGGLLVSGGADREVKVWDVKTREKIQTLGKHTSSINALAWAPGAPAVLAVTSGGAGFAYTEMKAATGVRSGETTAKERTLDAVETALNCLAATPNADRVFAGAHDGRVFFWNKDGKLVTTVQPGAANATASLAK
jgi:WD40 repeat protein/mono/diheme cytochrome c family protein